MTHSTPDLDALKQDLGRKAALTERLAAVRATKVAEQVRRAGLADRLRREKADVDRLEGLSLAAVLATLTGRRAKQVEGERAGYRAARLAYEQWAAGIAALQAQESELEAGIAALYEAESRYEAALAGREGEMIAAGGETAARLSALAVELGDARAVARGLDGAADAAAAAGKALDELAQRLQEAERETRYATDDDYGSATRRRERMDRAHAAAVSAGRKLTRLRREMAGIDAAGLAVRAGAPLLEVDDGFLGGFFGDWTVRQRVRDAQERVARTRRQVRTLTIDLRARASVRHEQVAKLERERRAILHPD